MRLIDADKLNVYDVSPVYGTCVMGVTEEDIELAPTVDAIPVEWINRWYDRNYMYSDVEIGDLLNDWKEVQEEDNSEQKN